MTSAESCVKSICSCTLHDKSRLAECFWKRPPSACPIVATNVGGTAELLVDGESALSGARRPAGRPGGHPILQLHGEPLLRHRLACAARERIVERFPIEKATRANSPSCGTRTLSD